MRGFIQKFFHCLGVEVCTCRFKWGGRHTSRRTEHEFETGLSCISKHEFNSGDAADVCDFVRIRNGRNGPVSHGDPGKFHGQEHRAFDVNVRINKPRHQKFLGPINAVDLVNHAVDYRYFRGVNFGVVDIDQISSY